MTNSTGLCHQLQQLWQSDFPLSNAMQMHVEHFEDHILTTRAALAPNTNTHGSAFGGSLYAIQALTAWSTIYLALAREHLQGSIIHASGQIEFDQPIRDTIVTRCSIAEHLNDFEQLRNTGKLRLNLSTQVVIDETPCSSFTGDFTIRLNKHKQRDQL
ncbi:MAG: YiiD C-terminal domain-containing protein [bacterium]